MKLADCTLTACLYDIMASGPGILTNTVPSLWMLLIPAVLPNVYVYVYVYVPVVSVAVLPAHTALSELLRLITG